MTNSRLTKCCRDAQRGRRSVSKALLAAAIALLLPALPACGRTPAPKTPPPSPAPAITGGEVRPGADGFGIYFLNVGDGDAALLSLPGGKWAMVDTGPAASEAVTVGMLRLLGVRRLEAVFLSHPHGDHAGGLDDVLNAAACPAIFTTPADYGKATEAVKKTAESHGVPISTMAVGQSEKIAGVTFTALGPNGTFADENSNSLVLMVEYKGVKALFPGDQLADAEAALLKNGYPLGCTILKAGHHGQGDASSEAFLKAASPEFCIVPTTQESLDNDKDGNALDRLNAACASVNVLDRTGTLLFSSQSMQLEPVVPKTPPAALVIAGLDAKAEYVQISNPTGADVNLSGWSIHSDKGNQFYFFPAGTVLRAGGSLCVYSGAQEAPEGLFWTEKKIWHDKKADEASLADPYGRVVSKK